MGLVRTAAYFTPRACVESATNPKPSVPTGIRAGTELNPYRSPLVVTGTAPPVGKQNSVPAKFFWHHPVPVFGYMYHCPANAVPPGAAPSTPIMSDDPVNTPCGAVICPRNDGLVCLANAPVPVGVEARPRVRVPPVPVKPPEGEIVNSAGGTIASEVIPGVNVCAMAGGKVTSGAAVVRSNVSCEML